MALAASAQLCAASSPSFFFFFHHTLFSRCCSSSSSGCSRLQLKCCAGAALAIADGKKVLRKDRRLRLKCCAFAVASGNVRKVRDEEEEDDNDEGQKRAAAVVELWKWGREQGVVGLDVVKAVVVGKEEEEEEEEEGVGLGLVAQRAIVQGEDVVSVPETLWINAAAIDDSVIAPFCQGLKTPWLRIALLLLHEKTNPNSRWRPYLDALPLALDSPLFWSNEELEELQGTQVLGSVAGYVDYVEKEFNKLFQDVIQANPEIFDPNVFTLEAFLWVFGILRSRTFVPLTGNDLALVPFADLVNHGARIREETASWVKKSTGLFWKAGKNTNMLVLRAPINFLPGEQVLMQYGRSKSNGELALDYGFVEGHSMGSSIRESLSLTLEISETDRFADDKLDIAELNGLDRSVQFDLVRGQGPPDTMLTFLRLTSLTGADAFLLEALFRNSVWGHLSLPVSHDNEEAVCLTMLSGLQAALAGYSTTTEEDTDLLDRGGLSKRKEIAIVIRLGEKRVLQELQTWFEGRMAGLDSLEYYAERRLRDLGLVDDTGSMTPWVFNE